ncbi:MAG: hypothetical protein Q8N63_01055 [Nanoarchaeota archaeon]|nr:hypothetical protein [Nanoarchaeota archaeon]
MSDLSEQVLSVNKLNRGLNKKKIRIKDIFDFRSLLTSLPESASVEHACLITPPDYQNSESGVADEENMKIVSGEFYEPDPEVLEALTEDYVVTEKDLSDSGIQMSIDSLCEREAWDENYARNDRQIMKAGIDNLKRKYG